MNITLYNASCKTVTTRENDKWIEYSISLTHNFIRILILDDAEVHLPIN